MDVFFRVLVSVVDAHRQHHQFGLWVCGRFLQDLLEVVEGGPRKAEFFL